MPLTTTQMPLHYEEQSWLPAPADHFTTTTMHLGIWEGTRAARAHDIDTRGGFEFEYESDQGSLQILSGQIQNIRGVTFCSPQMAAQTTSSITLRIICRARAFDANPPMIVKMVGAIAQWKYATNSLGTVWLNAGKSSTLGTSYATQGLVTIPILVSGGITLAAGDRIVADVWLEAENTSASNRNGRWGFLKWGLEEVIVPDVQWATTRFRFTQPLTTLQGVALTGNMWGGAVTVGEALPILRLIPRSSWPLRAFILHEGLRWSIHGIQVYDANRDTEIYLMYAPWETEEYVMTLGQIIGGLEGIIPTARIALWIGGRSVDSYDVLSAVRSPDGRVEIRPNPASPRRETPIMASNVEIANYALSLLGANPLTTLTEDTVEARLVNRFFRMSVDATLRAHPWNCAVTRSGLAQLAEAPPFGWLYQYELPVDCFCALAINDDEETHDGGDRFKIEGRKLLTNAVEADLRYIARLEDVSLYDALLYEALACRLAVALAYPLTGQMSIKRDFESSFQAVITEARAKDEQEGTAAVKQSRLLHQVRIGTLG